MIAITPSLNASMRVVPSSLCGLVAFPSTFLFARFDLVNERMLPHLGLAAFEGIQPTMSQCVEFIITCLHSLRTRGTASGPSCNEHAVLPVLSKSTRPSIVEWLGDYLKVILVNDVANSLLADHFRVVAVGLGNLLKYPHA